MAALSYGLVQRAKPGQVECGDGYWIYESPERCLVVVADGLGSGPAAKEASDAVVRTARSHADSGLRELLDSCHEALKGTRGAAVGVLAVMAPEQRLAYAGVGNIEVRTMSATEFKPVSTSGIVGANYRPPKVQEGAFRPGDWLVVHSDGLNTRFDLERALREPGLSPQRLAERLAEEHARPTDDLVLIVLRLGQ